MAANVMRILFLTVAILLFQSHAQAVGFIGCKEQVERWPDVSGRWIAYVGPIDLKADGQQVRGIYNNGDWALTLRYSQDRKYIFGQWDHLNGMAGPVIFFLDDKGCIGHAKYGATGKPPCLPGDYSSCVHDWPIHGRAIPAD